MARKSAKKSTSAKSGQESVFQRVFGTLWRGFLSISIIAACIGTLAVAGYAVYLDRIVRTQFEGVRWELPAQVYAKPLELYPGYSFSQKELMNELDRLGYREDELLRGAGAYHVKGSAIDMHIRGFGYWDGEQPSKRVRAHFSESSVATLTDLDSDDAVSLLRIDPLLIGSIYPSHGEDRVLVKLDEVPSMFSAGLILIEDRRFLKHWGVDPVSIFRAFVVNMKAGRVVQGGSTLTQQLVKNFFLDNRRTMWRKVTEAMMAVLLEIHYDKREILEAYINEVYVGQDGSRAIHGFGLGSYFYFKKPLKELQPHEIALMVALVKGPSQYDPRRRPKITKQRRDLVLDEFHKEGFITTEEVEEYKSRGLGVVGKAGSTSQYPAFVDLVRRQLHGQYVDDDLTSEGLKVFTTLDPRIQAQAEKHIADGLTELEKSRGLKEGTLQAAAVVTSTDGAQVLAVVGGRNPRYAGFNRALDALRPIGSLAKPVSYLAALRQPERFNLLTLLEDEELELPQRDGSIWRPQNYDKRYRGEVSLHQSLERSYNIPTVRLALKTGLPNVVRTFEDLGFKRRVMAVPSLSLGAIDMAPLEVAQLYNTLATGGYYSPLLSINSVTTKDGEPLSHYQLELKQAVPEGPVYLLNWALQRVMRVGTARSAYSQLPRTLNTAGKTGTTDDLRDSWFAGFSGSRLTVVWLGRDDNKPSKFSGSQGALKLWTRIMKDIENDSFSPPIPDDVETFPFNPNDIEHDDDDACDDGPAFPVPFIRGSMPEDYEPCDVDGFGGSRKRDPLDWFWKIFR